MTDKPKYWDSWKGQILRAIIIDNASTWGEVKRNVDLTHKQMYKAVGELQRLNAIEYSKDKDFRVIDADLRRGYEESENEKSDRNKKETVNHFDWIRSWAENNEECNANLGNLHTFLEGRCLLEITRKLITRAKSSVHAINPFVDKETLGTCLRNAAKRGVEVLLITRRPRNYPERWRFHRTLIDENVSVYYSGDAEKRGGVHSKVVIVDDNAAIVSSMNFTLSSEGSNHEAGVLTLDKDAIESAKEYISSIKDENETKDADSCHQPWL
jgi:hypothetical protein